MIAVLPEVDRSKGLIVDLFPYLVEKWREGCGTPIGPEIRCWEINHAALHPPARGMEGQPGWEKPGGGCRSVSTQRNPC